MNAFLFDVDDTLYDQLHPFESAFRENRKVNGVIPLEELYKSFRYHSDKVFYKTENGEMSLEDMYIYRASQAFKDFGISISRYEALKFQYDYVNSQKSIRLLPDMLEALNYCQDNKVLMGIITNGSTEHQKNKIKQLGLYKWINPEHIFISAQVGFAKPDIRVFKLAEKIMHLEPKETYFIGDSFSNDVIGAKNAEWKAIWCNRRNHSLPDGILVPDYIINENDSLVSLLKSIIK